MDSDDNGDKTTGQDGNYIKCAQSISPPTGISMAVKGCLDDFKQNWKQEGKKFEIKRRKSTWDTALVQAPSQTKAKQYRDSTASS